MSEDLVWTYPILHSLVSPKSPRDLAEEFQVPTSTIKRVLYALRKLSLVKKEGDVYVLTERGKELLNSFVPLNDDKRRMIVKGEDGCFLIIFKRKKGLKSVRVPCKP
jgi:DNA-binding MarR family transcriptional regulator